METSKFKKFIHDYFLANGIVWFIVSVVTLIFNVSLGEKELIIILTIPLAFCIWQLFSNLKTDRPDKTSEEK